MAIVDFSNLDQELDLRKLLASFSGGTGVTHTPTEFSWTSPLNNLPAPSNDFIKLTGSNFLYSGNVPALNFAGGASIDIVTSVLLDIDNDNHALPEIKITGVSFILSALQNFAGAGYGTDSISTGVEKENDAFWRLALSGNDTIAFGSHATTGNFSIHFNGDGRNSELGGTFAGSDTITGNIGGGFVSGDFYDVLLDGAVIGGNDKITVDARQTNTDLFAYGISGDAHVVWGFVEGGNDTLRQLATANAAEVYGDAAWVDVTGVLRGGNDIITLASAGHAFGDAREVSGVLIAGNDSITGSSGADELYGDVQFGTPATNNTLLMGNDTVHGGGGGDVIRGDYYFIAIGSVIKGGADRLYGEAGNDTISGEGGSDLLVGGDGDDQLHGGSSLATTAILDYDTMQGGAGMDTLTGGTGRQDLADFSDKATKVTVVLSGGAATVTISASDKDTLTGIEYLAGGRAGDKLTGDDSANLLIGNAGKDTLAGGNGADTLRGGVGNDSLTGGGAADAFRFDSAVGASNIDTITDFSHAQGDKLQLDNAVMAKLGAATGALGTQFYAHAGAVNGHDANDHIVYNSTNGKLYYDSNGSGAGGATQIAVLTGHPALVAGDLLIV